MGHCTDSTPQNKEKNISSVNFWRSPSFWTEPLHWWYLGWLSGAILDKVLSIIGSSGMHDDVKFLDMTYRLISDDSDEAGTVQGDIVTSSVHWQHLVL